MGSFESIVRPFQRPAVTLPERVFDSTVKETTDVDAMFGKDGEAKVYNESFSEHITTFVETEAKELHRETFKKRIVNPDDEAQHVDVEVIKKLTTEQGEGKNYERVNLTLNNKE